MEDKISIHLIFNSEEVTFQNVEIWFREMIFFKPTKMRGKILTKNRLQDYDDLKFQEKIGEELQTNDIIKISVEDNENNFSLVRGAYDEDITWIVCNLAYDLYENNKDLIMKCIDDFMQEHNGIVAYACSLEDEFWQNNEDIDYYVIKGRSIENVYTKQSPIFPDDKIVDVEYNPGHSHIVKGIWFGSCWRMWFGKEYFRYVPKEVLVNYQKCYQNTEMASKFIKITLYENLWDYDLQESRQRQKEFRYQTGIDGIAHSFQKREKTDSPDNDDVSIEINTIDNEHGGIKEITYYYNESGDVVPKSSATKIKTYKLDNNGQIVQSEVKRVNNE